MRWKEGDYNLQMGSCISTGSKRVQDNSQPYDQPIDDYPETESSRSLQLAFHCLFSKLKIKRCPHYQQLQARVTVAELDPFELKPKFLVREAALWEVEHFLELKATEYSLRRSYLVLSARTIAGDELAQLKINLYLLATGPYHQEFALPLPHAPSTRVSFNFKASQMIHLSLAFRQVDMTPRAHVFPGDTFTFALRAILGDKSEESDPSRKYVIDFQQPEKTVPPTEDPNGISEEVPGGELGTFKMASGKQGKVVWKDREEERLPWTEAYAPYYQLEKASFNVVFYHFPLDHKEFYSECYVSYNKIAEQHAEETHDAATGLHWLERQVHLELNTWDHGQQAGQARFRFAFRVQTHIKQAKMCVRTEKGILEAGPIFSQKGDGNFPSELEELQVLTNEVQNLFMEIAKEPHRLQTKKEKDLWNMKVVKRLQRQEEILMSSTKQSRLMFAYQSQQALMRGQKGLIQLGFRTKDMLNEVQGDITASCWQILSALIKRSELSLSHLGISEGETSEGEEVKKKRAVAVSYYTLLVDLLQVMLQSFDGYPCDQKRDFAEHFCAYAYFAVPQFRSQLLTAITRSNDPELEQAGTDQQLGPSEWIDSMSMKEISLPGRNSFSLRFDWEGSFIRPIASEEGFVSSERRLCELLRGSGWEERMRRRGGAFFAFVRCWVGYVESTAVNLQSLDWRYFPGYSRILHAFLAELHLRPIEQTSQGMRQAASALLANENLLSPFVVVLMKKTNAMNQIAVAKTMQLIHHLFASVAGRCSSLPPAFDVKYFLKGLKVVLEGESSYAISKTLLLLYDHFLLFPVEFRVEIALYLLSRVFFKLFLHWCANVRTLFHHLLLARLYHQATLPLAQLLPDEQDLHHAHPEYRTEIAFRYKKLMGVLENAEETQYRLQRHKVDVFEREMFKRMRNRASQRRRHSTPPLDDRALMAQLMQPRIDSLTSEELAMNFSSLLPPQQESRRGSSREDMQTRPRSRGGERRHKRISYFDSLFESELVPIKEQQIVYVKTALEEYRKVNERLVEHLQRDSHSVPPVAVELSLDEKELRPEAQFKPEEW